MKDYKLLVGLMVSVFVFIPMALVATAATNYVDKYGMNPVPNYTNWSTAATSIQDAVSVAVEGNTVLVSNGTYYLTDFINITAAITCKSVNGRDVTIVDGNNYVGKPVTNACFYLNLSGVVLDGFTIRNGNAYLGNGGGVNSRSNTTNTMNNCTVSNNTATYYGGGVYLNCSAILNNCIVAGNMSGLSGGGLRIKKDSRLKNCLIVGNVAEDGGGLVFGGSGSSISNCTISGNSALGAGHYGGGVHFEANTTNAICNCIIWGNTDAYSSSNIYAAAGSTAVVDYTCSGPVQLGTRNIGSDPSFVNTNIGNYRLAANSPCVNTGTNQDWMTNSVDLDGRTRIRYGTVDMGAYETIYNGTVYRIP